jgi:hypothetical protein
MRYSLIIISSDNELAFWIGGNDTKYENNYQWVDGQSFLYTSKFSLYILSDIITFLLFIY